MRGRAGADREALVDVLRRVSQLASDFPEIEELDLNPLLAWQNGSEDQNPQNAKAGRSDAAAAVTGGRTPRILPLATAAVTTTNSDFH